MPLNYDLHSHTRESDGSLEPAALVSAAHAAGVDVLALTDHDTTAGLAAAQTAARRLDLQLVPGVEISVSWQGQTVHILGLWVQPDSAPLQHGLATLRQAREERAVEIDRRLARAGIGGAHAGARRFAQGNIVSRTHFAQFLVEQGHAQDVRSVFRRFLVNGKPGHVSGRWAALDEALGWIRAAGGLAVIAHPARYRMTSSKLQRLVAEFRECGGVAMEVISGSHSADDVRNMAVLCRRHRLFASCGSDFHDPENAWIRLGELPALPDDCTPVWASEHWPTGARQ